MAKKDLVPEVISKRMRAIRGRDTTPELLLRSALRKAGIRHRSHATLPGRPDIVIPHARIAVFVDGDFWHGYDWNRLRAKLSISWRTKILSNRRRDRRIGKELESLGWRVIRLWEHEIHRNPSRCVARISSLVDTHLGD